MFAETLFVEIARALHDAVVVRPLGVFVNLEWSFTARWHVSSHEGSCVLLESRALG